MNPLLKLVVYPEKVSSTMESPVEHPTAELKKALSNVSTFAILGSALRGFLILKEFHVGTDQ